MDLDWEFLFTKQFGKRSNQGINSIRKATSVSVFRNKLNRKRIAFTDVEILKHKRNKIINMFFDIYIDNDKFSLIEFGIPYLITDKVDRIILKVKRRCLNNGFKVLGCLWVFDVGEENAGAHYHLVMAIKKYKAKSYPDFLKIDFKKQSVHGSFVRHRNAFRRYLLIKDIFERGLRKRVYGNTRCFKES